MPGENVWGGDLADLADCDLDPSGRDLDGTSTEVMKQALFRRLTTEPGGLWYDLTYGINLRALLSDATTPTRNASLAQAITNQCLLDERIDNATTVVDYDQATQSAVITIHAFGATGPFDLVLAIDQVSVKLLNEVASG